MTRRFCLLLAVFIVAGILPATMTGCSCKSQLKTQAEGFEATTREIFREYQDIVIDGKPRPNFTEKDKEIRRNSLQKFKELVDQAKK